jgi:hypothetical protein
MTVQQILRNWQEMLYPISHGWCRRASLPQIGGGDLAADLLQMQQNGIADAIDNCGSRT